jgi:hypothetical protein
MLSGKLGNGTSAPQDDSDFGRESWFDIMNKKKRKRSKCSRTSGKKSTSGKRSTTHKVLEKSVDYSDTDQGDDEGDRIFDFRVSRSRFYRVIPQVAHVLYIF